MFVNRKYDSDTLAGQYMELMKSMVEASDHVSKEDLRGWFDDLMDKDSSGEFFFSFNRYIFTAARP